MSIAGSANRCGLSSRAKRWIFSASVRWLRRRSLTSFGMTCVTLGLSAALSAVPAQAQRDDDRWRAARERLVAEHLVPQGISDSATLAAMRAVPRHEFVPPDQRPYAYENTPLPIGNDQTISQPVVVALMTQLVRPRAGMRVLEVGTGSGYQAAVLAETGARVWTIEIFRALAEEQRGGSHGWDTGASPSGMGTAMRAGPKRRRSTRSWSPRAPTRFHPR
jgi:protein-L-isoaspartate(D-aspartate) O-methyltransferase (PCMT)